MQQEEFLVNVAMNRSNSFCISVVFCLAIYLWKNFKLLLKHFAYNQIAKYIIFVLFNSYKVGLKDG